MRQDTSLRTLIELVKLGARRRLVSLSTSELGRVLHLTQQGASVRLLELEREGMIERTHYDDTVLELISPVNLRRELKLKDGDELSATVHLE